MLLGPTVPLYWQTGCAQHMAQNELQPCGCGTHIGGPQKHLLHRTASCAKHLCTSCLPSACAHPSKAPGCPHGCAAALHCRLQQHQALTAPPAWHSPAQKMSSGLTWSERSRLYEVAVCLLHHEGKKSQVQLAQLGATASGVACRMCTSGDTATG